MLLINDHRINVIFKNAALFFDVLVFYLFFLLCWQVMNPIGDHHPFSSSRVRPDTSTAACNGFGPNHGTNNQTQQNQTFTPVSNKDNDAMNSFEQYFLKVLAKVHTAIEMNEQRLVEEDAREKIKLEWQHVARIIDRVLLTIFVLVTLTTTLAIMVQAE